MKILALDPATKTGWAHSDGAGGTWDLSVRRDESSGMKLLRLHGKLTEIRASNGIDLIVFEAARNAAPKMQGALVVQAEIQGAIKLWCHNNGVDYRGYSPSEIKKHATGKGNASKQQMCEAANVAFGAAEHRDDNQADAMWILDLAQKELCK